jgi:lysine 2,3-aminomutase
VEVSPRTKILTVGKVANTVQGSAKLLRFLNAVLPDHVPYDKQTATMQTREELVRDVLDGMAAATMAIRMT